MKDARRILVVDDDPGIGHMLTKALARHGFQVDAATSADEALEKSDDRQLRRGPRGPRHARP